MKNGKLYLVSQHPGHNALYFLAAIIVLVALSSRADTIVWTNTAGGNWSAAANWSPNQVPGATDTVQINSAVGNYTVIVDDDATAASLTVGGAASGIQSLDVANGASLTLGTVNSTVNKNGTLTVKAGGTLDVGYYLYLYSPLTNYGTINVTNYSIAIANNGTSYLGSLLNLGRINLLDHNGVGIIRNSYNDDYFINEGTVVSAVAATISMSAFTNSGAITAETGTLQLNSVTLQPSGSLNAGLNSASDYGKLSISGNAALAGAFGVQLNNGFVPAPNTPFAVLSYDSFSGNFDSFNLPASLTWQRIYGTNALTLVPRLPFVSKLSGTNLVLNVTRDPGTQFVLLTSTNVTQPLLQWTPLLTNTLDISGYFSVTNLVKPDKPQQFFILKFP